MGKTSYQISKKFLLLENGNFSLAHFSMSKGVGLFKGGCLFKARRLLEEMR